MKLFKYLLVIIGLTSSIYAQSQVLSEAEVNKIELGMLKGALERKDVQTLSSIGLSFLTTSESQSYTGDRKKLKAKAEEIISRCAKLGDTATTMYILTSYRKEDPAFALDIAKEYLYATKDNIVSEVAAEHYSISMLYVALVLDSFNQNQEEINGAIEVLMNLKQESAEKSFYLAYLFNAAGNYDLADTFLNKSCHKAKPGSKVYRYCANASDIVREDPLEEKVSNSSCQKDIGKRCK